MDDTDHGTVSRDADRVREAAPAVTEPVVPGDGKGDARHYGTGVLPGHRGPADRHRRL
ncbi:hypothetical protein [Spongiactinospora gelatinilytica]|uniref:hypothetical protein n=1 Tax=Spongiactinospora gelatinilytica TaxID=2666298 RepID=UPI0018F6C325|nr:hypothetical protein [Spongiactinospora gelatinilytica]